MTADDYLEPQFIDGTWTVLNTLTDARWWPCVDARAQVEAAPDPALRALAICLEQPMLGDWRD